MRAIPSVSATKASSCSDRSLIAVALIALVCMTACVPSPPPTPINIKLYQDWELQPGDRVGDRQILGGLGDISIALNGNSVYAPFNGRTQIDKRGCLIFSSPDVPAYRFRFCGLNHPRFGMVSQGDGLGRGHQLEFAALRRQPNGTWAIVEPSQSILERTLTKP